MIWPVIATVGQLLSPPAEVPPTIKSAWADDCAITAKGIVQGLRERKVYWSEEEQARATRTADGFEKDCNRLGPNGHNLQEVFERAHRSIWEDLPSPIQRLGIIMHQGAAYSTTPPKNDL